MSSDRFDNFYITDKFREINAQRLKQNKDTVLPLTRKEKRKFIEVSEPENFYLKFMKNDLKLPSQITSCRLIKKEKLKILNSGFYLFFSASYILCILFADYSLFWLLAKLNYHGTEELGVESEGKTIRTLQIHTTK